MKKRVLFVCIGNCCRSPMAQGLAKHYGSDVLHAESSGLSPTQAIAAQTVQTMADRNIDIAGFVPRGFETAAAKKFDLIINLSGFELPGKLEVPVREWKVRDPIGESPAVYLEVCNDLELRVMQLILELRRERSGKPIASSHRKR